MASIERLNGLEAHLCEHIRGQDHVLPQSSGAATKNRKKFLQKVTKVTKVRTTSLTVE